MKPKIKIKITQNKNKPTHKSQVAKLKQSLIERMFGDFRVLGRKIYVSDIPTIFRIGHLTGILECSERFTLLDKKIQEFFVVQMLDIYENQKNLKSNYNKVYLDADKKALSYVLKKYPKTPKIFWIFALKNILSENMIQMNILRIENAISVLKSKNDKNIKKISEQYKKQAEEHNLLNKSAIKSGYDKTATYKNVNSKNSKIENLIMTKRTKTSPDNVLHKREEKNITMRSNKMSDMSNQLRRKYPQYTIIDKGLICNNFGIGGFKYYQRFWVRLKK